MYTEEFQAIVSNYKDVMEINSLIWTDFYSKTNKKK